MVSSNFIVTHEEGFHARVVELLSAEASKYTSAIKLLAVGKTVNLKSIMGVLSLRLLKGDNFTLEISGVDEEITLNNLISYLENNHVAKTA